MGDQNNRPSSNGRSSRTFNPNDYIIQLKGREGFRDYLPVQWRLAWFRDQCPHGSIETEMLHLDLDRDTEEEVEIWNPDSEQHERIQRQGKGFVIFRAIVKDGNGGVGVGTKSEKAASFPDYIEKAETGAIGRALAALGFGTQFAPELNEEHRIVDSPVSRPNVPYENGRVAARQAGYDRSNGSTSASETIADNTPATEQQISSIRKLRERLGKTEPEDENITYLNAKKLIQQLSAEYRASRQNSKAS